MSHRDDLDAALHRITSLERELDASERDSEDKADELATLRAEVARLRTRVDKEDKEDRRRQQKDEKAKLKAKLAAQQRRGERSSGASSKLLRIGLGALVVSGIVATGILLPPYCARRAAHTKPGNLERVQIVKDELGNALLLSSASVRYRAKHHSYTFWRLDLIDPGTGKRRKRLIIDGKLKLGRPLVADAGSGKLWFVYQRQRKPLFELRSVGDLALLMRYQQFVAKIPQLSRGLYGRIELEVPGGRLVATTRAGDRFFIAADGTAAPFAVAGLSNTRGHRRSLAPYFASTTRQAQVDGVHLALQSRAGLPKYVLARADSGPLPGASDLLSPHFITEGMSRRAITLPDKGGFVIVRAPSLGRYETMHLSRLGFDGKLGWTVDVPTSRIKLALLHGGRVVLALKGTSRRKSQIVAIDAKAGRIVWRVEP